MISQVLSHGAPQVVIDSSVTANNRGPKLPWTNAMVVMLLKVLHQSGAHLANYSNVTKAWLELMETLHETEEFSPYKSLHFKDGDGSFCVRKIRDKYKALMDNAEKKNFEGDTEEMQLLRMLKKEIEVNDAEKKAKNLLDKIEDGEFVGTNRTPKRSFSASMATSSNKKGCFEEKLISLFSEKESAVRKNDESEVENIMNGWLGMHNKSFDDFLNEAGVKTVTTINYGNQSMELLINAYCSVGEKFSQCYFKKCLGEMGWPAHEFQKACLQIQKWKRAAVAEHTAELHPGVESSSTSSVEATPLQFYVVGRPL